MIIDMRSHQNLLCMSYAYFADVGEITEHERPEIILHDWLTVLSKRGKQNVKISLQEPLSGLLGEGKEPISIGVSNQSVVEHPEHLVHPQTSERIRVFDRTRVGETATLDNPGEISQIEEVVTLLWGWQEILDGTLVNL